MIIKFEFEVESPAQCNQRENGICKLTGPFDPMRCTNDTEFPNQCFLLQFKKELEMFKKMMEVSK